ncbi:hypothetical protein AVEN_63775-1 [Araneus ventricosus]|uniref:Retroviral polymerase SH3-like domain-containing protein n=1 Tax=Araneus ventricosus TaxID=182803 RepID=A0A4Y2GY71_ARAVE|nr:hypothetical protein AVEN_63775-1 [Araneus ventricosus]
MGYRVMDPVTRRITISRNVRFDDQEDASDLREENDKEMDIKLEETERAIDDKYPEFRRSQRERKPAVRYPFNEALSAINEEIIYDEIEFLPEGEQSDWKSAMNEEMLSMETNKVSDLIRVT